MKRSTVVRSTFALTLLLTAALGCDDDSVGADGGHSPGECGIPDSAAGATLSPGAPVTLDTVNTTVQNIDEGGQLATGQLGTLRHGPCGDAGLLLWLGEGWDRELAFVDPRSGGTPETVEADADVRDASLFFDADCAPLIVRTSRDDVLEYTRDAGGGWTSAVVLEDISTVVGEGSSGDLVAGQVGADGRLYVFLHAWVGEGTALVRGARDAAAGSSWSFEALPDPTLSSWYGYWVDGAGTTHALGRYTELPCDPCNVDFLHRTIAAGGTQWTTEVVQPGRWGNPYDAFVENASMAFDSAGNPFIAAHFGRHVVTGSFKSAELRLYGKAGGSWCGEIVTTKNDGYTGTDGSKFTGAAPQIAIDGQDRLHLLFLDMALWHAGGYENQMRGQLRHALRSGSSWTLRTLLSQQGQSVSPDPLIGTSAPLLSLSPSGDELVAAASVQSWQVGSSYNDEPAPASYTAQAVTAGVN